ncbi:hypothetical protein SUDANB6_02552 [Streptomyces sp. enrichment culture]|uniref:DUF2637 domain-containing protein n=1 Tax=Streptomyces sp. enrichment culture TaxID=1795815 RepID=UPI003F577739
MNTSNEVGTGRHRRTAEAFSGPLVPPDWNWDPAEELAFMLQDAMEERPPAHAGPETSVPAPAPGTPLENLQEITAELPPLRDSPKGHRKVREERRMSGRRAVSHLLAASVAAIACTVSIFGGMMSYDSLLQSAASHTQGDMVSWWPFLVYGPWMVASLSVLRAALHQRRAVHSWSVVLFFSCMAMLLCLAQLPMTVVDAATATLPALASLACFQQLVRQITLTRPPRRGIPRHRLRPPSAQAQPQPRAVGEPARATACGSASLFKQNTGAVVRGG